MCGGKMPSRKLGMEILRFKGEALGFWPVLEVIDLGVMIKATMMDKTFNNHEDRGSRKEL